MAGVQIIQGQQFTFDSRTGARLAAAQNYDFTAPVLGATAVLEGLDVEYGNRDDHHLGRLQVRLNTTTSVITQNTTRVTVTANFGLRDWSGGSGGDDLNGDDPVSGTVRYSVIIGTAP